MVDEQDDIIPVDNTPESIYKLHAKQKIEHLNRASEAILNVVASKRQVPETFFYHKLLPIVRDWYKNGIAERIGFWLNVADGMYKEIQVVDDDTKTPIFTLPPAYSRIPPKVIKRKSLDERTATMADIVDRQGIALENGDTRMVMQIEGALNQSVEFDTSSITYFKNLYIMMMIYERYEVPLVELLGESADTLAVAIKELFDTPSKDTKTPTPLVETEELGMDDYEL